MTDYLAPFGNTPVVATSLTNDILVGAPSWIVPSAVLFVVIGATAVWSYANGGTQSVLGWLAGLLKVMAVALLAICLLQPMQRGERPKPKANVLAILADNSRSMKLKASDQELSRAEQTSKLLEQDDPWRVRLAQAFDVRTYAFDSRLERVEQLERLPNDGFVSSLTGGLHALRDRLASRPVAGVMLFTDGNLTDAEAQTNWSELGFPVYPVVLSDEQAFRDLRITQVSVRQTDFETTPTTLRVQLSVAGMTSTNTIVQLRDSQQKIIQEKSIDLSDDTAGNEVTFRFRPEQSGISFYRVVAFTEAERSLFRPQASNQEKASTREATLDNNQRLVLVNRENGPYRVLYVAGRPNWEFKFLRRALQEDDEVQLVGLLRIAKKEPKFSFRDRGVSSTNPLFQGLGNSEEEAAAQYDEPVIIRLGVRESEELSDGFPDSAEELFAYHGVILDDVESEFFTQDQLLLLRRFVSTRGGGLLMLGGKESFSGKDFASGPLGELAPVYGPRLTEESKPGTYQLDLTREGLLQPWVRLRDNETAEKTRLAKMPPFTTLNAVGDLKPGATLLASVANPGSRKKSPAIAVQRFGKGRSAAMPIGDFWRWSMRRKSEERDDPAQMWRQTTRWLVNEVPRRAELRVEANSDPTMPVKLIATARDELYLPLDNASVQFTINRLGDAPFVVNADPDEQLPGVYHCEYWSRKPGAYQVIAKIAGPDGTSVGEAKAGWTVQTAVAEFQELETNRELLNRIASETGGEIVNSDNLSRFASELPEKKIPVTESWVYPIWHQSWVLFLAVMCLCTEWGLRRWKGLA